ncbi:MAG: hypothetical protein Q8800_01065 [Candidatus Phytoplasma australasiaticum]|nr:hypothetical protein [Candidatus Phytoplasma australasiaticum]MDV3162465.1 hypothetical protein [Candidatus Phytoplasma australasiaticum]MDV3177449.1 hypothetical protein [Candidatus Phytoplasma australasiaticum]MDV3191541.1 hypothetical protein [Candidatus Phytoplasma australasiaticum]MDV3204160.1 hypothetical protein [Candidatus Phytoplasma australasiaticum]
MLFFMLKNKTIKNIYEKYSFYLKKKISINGWRAPKRPKFRAI